MSHHKVFRCRFLRCNMLGAIVRDFGEIVSVQCFDSSWHCPCGSLHCSECSYETDGIIMTVTDCGRFRVEMQE